WRMTIFHPFAHASKWGRGEVLSAKVKCDTYDTATHAGLPLLLTSVVHDPDTGAVTIFALNRSTTEQMALDVDLRGLGPRRIDEALELHHEDLKAINDGDTPDRVAPSLLTTASVDGARVRATLKPLSWNVIATLAAAD
ncbi:MAG: alpha-L-arabinofuranosidase C-terminal domain-containing protein, partial [Sphingomicrobium sp.]